nr:C-type mannose receptor 2-like [Lytechinus pictus]
MHITEQISLYALEKTKERKRSVEPTCSNPPSVENAALDSTPAGTIGEVLSYSCNDGFIPDGDLTTTCNRDDGGDTASYSSVPGKCVECHEAGGYELSNGRCYRLIDNEGSFEEQCRSCHQLNGQLAPALDEKQNAALTNFFLSKLPGGDNFQAWIGMHNMVDENSLQSVDLRSSSFTAYAPSADSASGRCVTVGREGWGKKCCFDRLRAVCELNLCDKGYVQVGNNCYRVVGSTNGGSTWEDNCRTCHRDGASLVSFSQASDVGDFLGYLGGLAGDYVGGSDLWIGCHDQATEGAFQTSSLQEFLFFGGVSRPSSNADGEDCCALNEHGVSAQCCYSCLRGVCSKPLNK